MILRRTRLFIGMLGLFCFSVPVSSGQIRFSDVTAQYNVGGYNFFGGHGVSWGDVNGDGLLDIYVKNVAGEIFNVPNNLFINYGSFFQEEAAVRGVSDAFDFGTHGAVLVDLDNDQDLDLFSTTTFRFPPARNHIYRNSGSGFFTDITSTISPPQVEDTEARGVAAGDFDGDGDIDLYYSNPTNNTDPFNPNPFAPLENLNFYMNNGDGTFSAEYRGIPWTSFTQGVVSIDVDGDGDIDIAEARWSAPSTVYLNDGAGWFSDLGEALSLPQDPGVRNNGLTFGDIDNDGDLDLAVMGPEDVMIYANTNAVFSWIQTISPDPSSGGAHVCLGDLDHDGDLDLYISGGDVYENDGNGLFTLVLTADSGMAASLDTEDARGSALGDFDGDGDLDIYIADADHYNVLLRNETNDSNWIQVEVLDNTGNKGGFGTKLDLYTAGHLGESQFLRGHREIHAEYGYLGQDMPIAHFGAPAGQMYDLLVTFTDGTTNTFRSITPGHRIQATYPRVLAPRSLSAEKKSNNALFYRETLIILLWVPNPENTDIVMYRLYDVQGTEKTLLMEFGADTLTHTFRHVESGKTYSFGVSAVDIYGREGEMATAIAN